MPLSVPIDVGQDFERTLITPQGWLQDIVSMLQDQGSLTIAFGGLNEHQIGRSCPIAQRAAREYMRAAEVVGIGWPLPPDWEDRASGTGPVPARSASSQSPPTGAARFCCYLPAASKPQTCNPGVQHTVGCGRGTGRLSAPVLASTDQIGKKIKEPPDLRGSPPTVPCGNSQDRIERQECTSPQQDDRKHL